MDELRNIDWMYNIPDGRYFLNDSKIFEQSATFRILKGNFKNPFLSDDSDNEEMQCESPAQPSDNVSHIHTKISKHYPKKTKDVQYIPGIQRLPLFPKNSSLSQEEHQICVKVLQYFNKNCTSMSPVKITQDEIQMYMALLPAIKEEQKLFCQFVSEVWKTKLCSRLLKNFPGHERFVEGIWRERLLDIKKYPRYYQMISMLPLVYMNEANPIEAVEVKRLQNEMGAEPIVINPNLKSPYSLPSHYEKILAKNSSNSSKCIVSEVDDKECEKYALEHGASIVISLSSLRHLANNYPPFSRSWNLPVSVKEYNIGVKGKNVIHSVAFIDHALPPQSLSSREKANWCYKMLLKKSLLHSKYNKYDANTPVSSNICHCYKTSAENFIKTSDISVIENDTSDVTSSDDEQQKLVIDVHVESQSPSQRTTRGVITRGMARKSTESIQSCPSPSEVKNKQYSKIQNKPTDSETENCTCGKSLEINKEVNAPETFGKQYSISDNSMVDGKEFTYSLWKVGQSQQESELSKTAVKDINIIVRSKADGYNLSNNETQKIVMEPKVEYQSDFGSECITAAEAASQWASLQFSPNSKLMRVKILKHTSDIMMIEEFSSQTFTAEIAKQATWKPKMALGCFFNIFSCLSKLHAGNYMLSHNDKHGAFAVLYHNVSESCENGLDLQKTFDIDPSDVQFNQAASWVPIDPSVVTPNLLKHNVLPCMFTPNASKLRKEVTIKKKIITKKKSKKKKRGSTQKKPILGTVGPNTD